jgi:hypothetical protein
MPRLYLNNNNKANKWETIATAVLKPKEFDENNFPTRKNSDKSDS